MSVRKNLTAPVGKSETGLRLHFFKMLSQDDSPHLDSQFVGVQTVEVPCMPVPVYHANNSAQPRLRPSKSDLASTIRRNGPADFRSIAKENQTKNRHAGSLLLASPQGLFTFRLRPIRESLPF